MMKRIAPVFTALVAILCLVAPDPADARNGFEDADITAAVEDALLLDPGVSSHLVDVSTEDGIVTLTGTVDNLLASDRAAGVARTVKGVRSVVNRLDVRETTRSDRVIRRDVEDALLFDPATDSYEVDVSVTGGVATLTGTVESWQEKKLAGKVARGVRGVTGVINSITVNYDAERADVEIREDIERRLHWDAYVDDALIDVSVTDGRVELTGVVGSNAEKIRALNDSWVNGVTDVDISGLEVEGWARDDRFRAKKYVDRTDAEVESAVTTALHYDPRVERFDVTVTSDEGRVRLSGTVDNVKARRAAAEVTRSTVGVWSVDNNLKVRNPEVLDDEEVSENVRDAIARDPYLESFEIGVNVVNGEANLFGTVDSAFEKARADDVASRVHGVIAVDNNLDVDKNVVMTFDPYVDDWYVYDYDWFVDPNLTTMSTDWEIREDIEDEFFWSPFVDGESVNVTVEGGVATLTGRVDTWSEWTAATENAYEGGATFVVNRLKVAHGPKYYE